MAHYDAHQHRRHECRPGITGWVAVNGRNTTTWQQRFEMDVHYVEHLGPWLDGEILLRTISTVLGRKGIDPGFADQMPEFGSAA
jgi:lipopolysaccharide/colanic/teichoic acid biosynthesis glycosyltransferase